MWGPNILSALHRQISREKTRGPEASSNKDKGTEPFIDMAQEVVRKCFLGKLLFILDLSNPWPPSWVELKESSEVRWEWSKNKARVDSCRRKRSRWKSRQAGIRLWRACTVNTWMNKWMSDPYPQESQAVSWLRVAPLCPSPPHYQVCPLPRLQAGQLRPQGKPLFPKES